MKVNEITLSKSDFHSLSENFRPLFRAEVSPDDFLIVTKRDEVKVLFMGFSIAMEDNL